MNFCMQLLTLLKSKTFFFRSKIVSKIQKIIFFFFKNSSTYIFLKNISKATEVWRLWWEFFPLVNEIKVPCVCEGILCLSGVKKDTPFFLRFICLKRILYTRLSFFTSSVDKKKISISGLSKNLHGRLIVTTFTK